MAMHLWESGAVKVSMEHPFVWASGKKSLIYCDNRIMLRNTARRQDIAQRLAKRIKQNTPQKTTLAGVATAGIPYATMAADILARPLLYVRTHPKAHGLRKAVEGELAPGERVVLVEDVVSTADSCLQAARHLLEAGAQLMGIFALFSHELPRRKRQLDEFLSFFSQLRRPLRY